MPLSTTVSVSTRLTVISAGSTQSASARICVYAVISPCPTSTRPTLHMTEPSSCTVTRHALLSGDSPPRPQPLWQMLMPMPFRIAPD